MIEHKTLTNLIQSLGTTEDKGITFIQSDSEENYTSYKELLNKALGILNFLQSQGIKQGEELVFQIEDNQNFIYVFWACILGGIIPVPVSVGNNEEHRLKLLRIWKVLNQPHLITTKKIFSSLEKNLAEEARKELLEVVKPNTVLLDDMWINYDHGEVYNSSSTDIAFIQFSSGSTGNPKGVTLTHENLISNITAIIIGNELTEADSTLSWMPLTHDMGLIGFHLVPLLNKMNQFIMPTSLFIRRPILWIKKAHEHKLTRLSSPNFGYKYFLSNFKPELATDWDLSSIRLIINGAEPISAELCKAFLCEMKKYGLHENVMFPVYGLAEASLAVTFPPVGEDFKVIKLSRDSLSVGDRVEELSNDCADKAVSFIDLGSPVKDCYVKICDSNKQDLEESIVGHIHIKGKNVTKGYYNNKSATQMLITEDGWLDTGDLGFLRNGRLVVTGRSKDIIFVNGQNFYPHDIERVAEEIDGIELGEIAACSAYDNQSRSEEILLFVLFKKELLEFIPLIIKLKKHIRKTMGLDVKNIIPLKKMPKTTSGKIQRYKLSERYEKDEFTTMITEINDIMKTQFEKIIADEDKNEIEEKLAQLWRAIFEVESIGINDNFFELSGDSLLHTQFTVKVQEEFNIEISYDDFVNHDSIAKLSSFIYEKKN